MKKSTEYAIGESVVLADGRIFTKKTEEIKFPNSSISTSEIWCDELGNQYAPSLSFIMGNSEPSFFKLMME